MYDRAKDIERRVGYLISADIMVIKDMMLKRARDLAKAQPERTSPQDAAALGYEQARAEYAALIGENPTPELPEPALD